MYLSFVLPLITLAGLVLGDTHYFYSGFFSGSSIVGVEFDDSVSTLTLTQNITIKATATGGSKWIAIDVRHASVTQKDSG